MTLKKDLFKLRNNYVFEKTMENVSHHRYIKLVTTDKKRNQLIPEPHYHTTKWFSENLLATEMKKINVKMNKPIYLLLSTIEISERLTYEFWYDYIKPKYQSYKNLCHVDIDSFNICINICIIEDVDEDMADDVEKRFDTSNHEVNRQLSTGKNKKVIGLMKYELGGNIMTEFAAFRPKTYSYLIDDSKNDKKEN